ncbi:unnamed protein product [Auanema sp. JU1783]|nr:unnamed protein product [Auanema sp. JU1783]
MRFLLYFFACLALTEAFSRKRFRFKPQDDNDGETYAVLVAGSNGWYNYRHQADVAHAYHTLRKHGISEDNIIVMMYDDIANNTQNPYPGKIFNEPDGPDVYEGLKIDYRAKDVTVKNFIKVLKGDNQIRGGNGRVLETNSNDRIFIYFTDHGATGLISFPDEILSVKELNSALQWLHSHKKFAELVFYLEACESGSMFEKVLPSNLNIYAITAANGHESSWGTYCENDMGLPCLGDLFSVNWMIDSDDEDLNVETLQQQFELVKAKTTKSHVLQFGDLSIAREPVGNFQGETKQNSEMDQEFEDDDSEDTEDEDLGHSYTMWPSRDVLVNSLIWERSQTNDYSRINALSKQISEIREKRRQVKRTYHSIVHGLFDSQSLIDEMITKKSPVLYLDCHHKVVHKFNDMCFDFHEDEQALNYVYILNNLCNYFEDEWPILDQITRTCDVFNSL